MSGPLIAPSVLSADPGRLFQELEDVTMAGADWLHLDVMDGNFVPNITFGAWIVKLAKKASPGLPADCHLMVEDPLFWAPAFAEAGADSVSVHAALPHRFLRFPAVPFGPFRLYCQFAGLSGVLPRRAAIQPFFPAPSSAL